LTGGVVNQAQYGPGNVCLFYINNYHVEESAYVFSARSSECQNLIALGSFGIVLSILVTSLFLFFTITEKQRPSAMILVLSILSTIYSVICLVGAGTATAGLNQTCNQFQGLTGGSCGSVFATGFMYDGDSSQVYSKNLDVVISAVNASWLMTIAWTAYSGLEWYNWKTENGKWW
jgi:hypothetical protein